MSSESVMSIGWCNKHGVLVVVSCSGECGDSYGDGSCTSGGWCGCGCRSLI